MSKNFETKLYMYISAKYMRCTKFCMNYDFFVCLHKKDKFRCLKNNFIKIILLSFLRRQKKNSAKLSMRT